MNALETFVHLFKPSASGDVAANRTILLLHGMGADEHDLLGLGRALDPNANLLSPRGRVRGEMPPYGDGMIRWFMRYEDGSFDEDGIVRVCDQLAEFLSAAASEYGFDINNLWVAGFSNGANAAGALLLLHPELIRGAIAFCTTKGLSDTLAARDGVAPDLSGKHVFICNGEVDHYSPVEKTTELVAEFETFGADVQLRMQSGGHTISHEHVREIAQQLRDL